MDCKVSIEFGVRPSEGLSVMPSECSISHNAFLPGKWELFRIQHAPIKSTSTEYRDE